MFCSPTYTLQSICGVPYLLPFGQGIATFRRQLRLNDTGALLWRSLQSGEAAMDIPEADRAEFWAQLQRERAVHALDPSCAEGRRGDGFQSSGLSYPVSRMPLPDNFFSRSGEAHAEALPLEIGGIPLRLCALSGHFPGVTPEEPPPEFTSEFTPEFTSEFTPEFTPRLFSEELFSFRETAPLDSEDKPLLRITFADAGRCKLPSADGPALIDRPNLSVADCGNAYLLRYPGSRQIARIYLSLDGQRALFYLCGKLSDAMRYDVFHAIRLAYSYLAGRCGRFLMHSASFRYRGRAYLFSGPSGTGKSTHVALWRKAYGDEISDINGDLNLLSVEDGKPTVHGIPWNGTSGIYSTGETPLGGIVLLHQAPENRMEVRSSDRNALSVLQRLISPAWTEAQLVRNLRFAETLAGAVPVWNLYCTKDREAAELMRAAIDETLQNT